MYAVLKTGGKQYRVEPGSTLIVEKVRGEPGSSITFDRILLVGDGDAVTVGSPTVSGAWVSATVLGEALGPKLVVFKFKQKVKYRRRTGHRQHLTRLRIDSISTDGRTVSAEPPEPKVARVAPSVEQKPARRRAAKAEAPAEPAAKPARGTSKRAAPEATAEPAAEPVKASAAARPRRARAGTASKASEATSGATEEASSAPEAKPRARRTTKPKTESAEEE